MRMRRSPGRAPYLKTNREWLDSHLQARFGRSSGVLPRRRVPWSGGEDLHTSSPVSRQAPRGPVHPLRPRGPSPSSKGTRRDEQRRWGGSTPTTPLLSVWGCEWGSSPLGSLILIPSDKRERT